MLSEIPDVKTGYIVKNPYRKIVVITRRVLLVFIVIVSAICFLFGEPLSAIIFVVILWGIFLPFYFQGMWINTKYILSPQGVALTPGGLFSKHWEKSIPWDLLKDVYPNDMVFKILYEEHEEKYLEFRKGSVSVPQKKRKHLVFWGKENNAICIPWSEEALLYVKKYWNNNAGQEKTN